jgi:hypothetical protein
MDVTIYHNPVCGTFTQHLVIDPERRGRAEGVEHLKEGAAKLESRVSLSAI